MSVRPDLPEEFQARSGGVWLAWSGLLGFIGVGAGAFGAHGLRGVLSDRLLEVYQTAVFYHLVHALALGLVAVITLAGIGGGLAPSRRRVFRRGRAGIQWDPLFVGHHGRRLARRDYAPWRRAAAVGLAGPADGRVEGAHWPAQSEKRGMSKMKIMVNGEPRDVADSITIGELIEEMNLSGRRLAIEVNLDIVPRSQHQQHRLRENDVVEVVHAIGGG